MVDELPRINTPEQINYYLQSWAQTDLNAEIIPVLVCISALQISSWTKFVLLFCLLLHKLPDAVQLIKVLLKSFIEFA